MDAFYFFYLTHFFILLLRLAVVKVNHMETAWILMSSRRFSNYNNRMKEAIQNRLIQEQLFQHSSCFLKCIKQKPAKVSITSKRIFWYDALHLLCADGSLKFNLKNNNIWKLWHHFREKKISISRRRISSQFATDQHSLMNILLLRPNYKSWTLHRLGLRASQPPASSGLRAVG